MKRHTATPFAFGVALHGEEAGGAVALCAALNLGGDGEVPEWVHLLPNTPQIETFDGRGPYRLVDAQAVVRASLQAAQERPAVLDENHSTDLAAPRGESAPARGWFTDYQARADGIWGKVDWNRSGRRLMVDRSYRGISPVIVYDAATKVIKAIVRASLINKPNLRGLQALNMESDMDLLTQLIAKLNLPTDTSADVLVAKVVALQADATALQGQLTPIALAAGLQEGASAEAVLGAVTQLKTKPANAGTIEALQAELNTVATELNTLKTNTARERATAFVDGAIGAKTVGVAPLREHYIAMHMENPGRVEKEIGALPKLGATHTAQTPSKDANGNPQLSTEDNKLIAMFGISPDAFAKTRAAEGVAEATA